VNLSYFCDTSSQYSAIVPCSLLYALSWACSSHCLLLIGSLLTGSFGLAKPWYFPLTTRYWCGGAGSRDCLGRSRGHQLSVMEDDQAAAAAEAAACSSAEESLLLGLSLYTSRQSTR